MQDRANGIDIHYEISGRDDAPPLLCLHSLATDGRIWDRQIATLDDRFRVIRPDFRGHGSTQATAPPYSIGMLVEDTVVLLDVLGIERVSVMGVSLGAIVAIGMALDAAERVDRIVIADCRADAPDAYVAMWDTSIATVLAHGLAPVIESSVARWFSPAFRDAQPELVDEVRRRALRTPVDGFIGGARAVQGLGYLPRLGEIAVPALFLVGGADPAAPPAVMRHMSEQVTGSLFVELDGIGHLTPYEASDGFTDAVLAFLQADVRSS